jgi:6-pyruvoyltetrahydropterin/6-carboxytetrahydropterin synthase
MPRWVVHSSAEFEARHALTSYRGQPEEPHGHRWKVAIRVGADRLGAEGYAVDFHEVHSLLAGFVSELDGTDLNRHPEIARPSPSAERVAQVLADRLAPKLAAIGAGLLSVSVWEGPENRVDLQLD